MAIYANISIDQGADFSTQITVEDATGYGADLTGYNIFGQIRKTYSSTNKVDFVCSHVNAGEGIIQIKLVNSVTNSMKPGRYVYDVEVVSPAGEITRVVEGQVSITPGVTR
jgi:hypothetical protein